MDQTSSGAPSAARILIVDDLADNRDMLARRFERRGFKILEAEGGRRALEMIAEGGVDIVLLDVVMPDMDGLEVLKRVRETQSTFEMPIILVTAQAESRDVVVGLELGANDYITKPVDFEVALARVATQLRGRQTELALLEANQRLEKKVAELRDAVLRAEAANWAKTEFLANVGLGRKAPAPTEIDGHQRELIGIITASGSLLEDLLSDVVSRRGRVASNPVGAAEA